MAPTSIRLRTYQVGFGDCFLLTFRYPDRDRHVLMDFGSTGLPADAPKTRMLDVAKDIDAEVRGAGGDGRLTAVVATHRHKDHVSGFDPTTGSKKSGLIIAALKPELVIQPWTEDPRLDPNATGPTLAPNGPSKPKMTRVSALSAMQMVAGQVVQEVKRVRYLPQALREELSFLGDDNIGNADAVGNLMSMGPNDYVHAGLPSKLSNLLPGVDVHVLGPPSVDQSAGIKKQRSKDPQEYWHLQAAAGRTLALAARGRVRPLFPGHVRASQNPFPEDARWLMYHARKVHGDQMLSIVRMLDKAMNNTSLILLFKIGGKSLLFPGDAQIENWSYALSQESMRKLLEDVDVYKVGHHGSLNATPKSLWELFHNRSTDTAAPARLTSVMSTMPGKHGSVDSKTEVPRTTLKAALAKESNLFSTEELHGATFFKDIEITF
jgi:hypothetical protein